MAGQHAGERPVRADQVGLSHDVGERGRAQAVCQGPAGPLRPNRRGASLRGVGEQVGLGAVGHLLGRWRICIS